MAAEGTLMDVYRKACGAGTHTIVLNFSGLEYMNSGGIGLLVTLLVRANRQCQRLLAYGLNDHYPANLADGRVEVVAEGPRAACEELLAVLRSGSTPGQVKQVTDRFSDARGDVTDFLAR